ncbi:hypothetical protein P3T76_005461 [Phytophthora citrophthora]|uniref:Transmembrane protein n=1 Tax=Phytophthora citrophthora TaxID=4793 RepID=A0AAD9GPX7_9STRA|nr:hypothetical protein P3T76_005461 [Phytophthora citrophthora]
MIAQVQVKSQGEVNSQDAGRQSQRSWVTAPSAPRDHQYLVGARAKKKLRRWHIFNLFRRLVVIAAAIQYIIISMNATSGAIRALSGAHNPPESFRVFTASLISGYVGKGLIGNSSLVQKVLGGDSTPRDYAIFLDSKNQTSFQNCSGLPKFNPKIYNFDYLSHVYQEMVRGAAYNISVLADFELVTVVVDCSFTNLKTGDNAMVRFFNLVRSRTAQNSFFLVTMSINVQDYELRAHNKKGPCVLSMISIVQDMKAGSISESYLMGLTYPYKRTIDFQVYNFVGITTDSYLELRSIPADPLTQPVNSVLTARKRGFYDGQEQSNIRYMYTLLDSNATTAMTRWEWLGEAVMSDSWAWVHALHFIFAMQTIFSLIVLCIMAYQNARMGKFWIGDPFASVSTASLFSRGVLVVISWYLNSFWMLFEFCMAIGGKISKTQIVRVHTELVHADVLVVYLSLVGVLSSIFRERIDPSVAIFLFEIIYSKHEALLIISAVIKKEVVTYSDKVFYLGVAKLSSAVAKMSPLKLWTAFQIPTGKDGVFIMASFFPYALLLSIIAGFAIIHKIYRRFYPDKTRQRSSVVSTDRSSINERTALTLKGNLTNFEISTGAELQTRFGIISDYSNYVYFKGMKFASADGVYCSGYVIVNGKLLIGTKHLLSVILIKATRSRFTNIYVYEVEGNTVKDTARLVYPETFEWSDLWHLNVTEMPGADDEPRFWGNSASSMTKLQVKAQGSSGGPSRTSKRSVRGSVFSREKLYVVKQKRESRKFTFWKGPSGPKQPRTKQKFTKWQLFNVARRLVVICAAFQYLYISLLATFRTLEVLRSMTNPTQSFGVLTASYISGYIGDGLIKDSPLIHDTLGGDTTPRDYALFLESETSVSKENCSNVPLFNADIYNNAFLSRTYMEMVRDTSYNTSILTDLELVVVVVDCSSTQLEIGDPSVVRVFNIARSLSDPTDLYLVTLSLSIQDYTMWTYKKHGPALVAMVTVIHDMQADITKQIYMMAQTYPYQRSMEFEIYQFIRITDESYRELVSIPKDPTTEPVKHLVTSRKRGFFDGEDQSNIHSTYSVLNVANATAALTHWEWLGESIIEDSWAWVHSIHFIFALQTISSLVVLGVVSYQNFLAGKVWIGDPFASVSTATFVTRGLLVLLSWYLNSFWTIFEFAMSNAAVLSGSEIVHVHRELVHADVLVIYLGIVAFLSWVFRERIDPSVAIFLFEIIHKHRLNFIRISPAALDEIVTYSNRVFHLGNSKKTEILAGMSPLNFWSTFQIPKKDGTFLAASFFPKITLLAIVAFYAILRKIYRRFYPEPIQQRSTQSTNQSANEKTAMTLKGHLTNFEISTGAELQARYGIISDYKNYVYFKGMKFASADGVYCSGYVIVNGKFLVSSKQLLAVIMMKLVRSRLTNIYVYEVEGNTVKDSARLVYPETFTWKDLLRLNVTVLL